MKSFLVSFGCFNNFNMVILNHMIALNLVRIVLNMIVLDLMFALFKLRIYFSIALFHRWVLPKCYRRICLIIFFKMMN